MQDATILYKCDPSKNKDCRKTCCYLNGGTCRRTRHRKYRTYHDKGMTVLQIRKKMRHIKSKH
jgi:hypothetical protein